MNIPTWLSFSLITLVVSVPFYWQIRQQGGPRAEGFQKRFRLLLWVPGLVAFGFRLFTGEGFADVGYGLGSPIIYLIAIALPLAVEICVIFFAIRQKFGVLSPNIVTFQGRNALIGKDFGLLIKGNRQTLPLFLLNVFLSITIGSLYLVLFTLPQEFGWRGYLQGLATGELGLARGLILVGLVWGIWYFPLVSDGYRFRKHPRLGSFVLMPLSTIALSIVSGWFYLVSGNIWAPALFHACVLVSADFSSIGLDEGGDDLPVRLIWVFIYVLIGILATFFLPTALL
jgi:membrane protease YdiL (CAAX protease family)